MIDEIGAKKESRANLVFTSLLALIYTVVGCFDYANADWLQDNPEVSGDPSVRKRAYTWTIPTVLLSITILLTIVAFNLLAKMKLHNRQSMLAEAKRVQTIHTIFILSYITRAIIYLLYMFNIEKEKNAYLIYYVFYNVWDVAPIVLIMHYHYTCYEAQQAVEDDDRTTSIVSVVST